MSTSVVGSRFFLCHVFHDNMLFMYTTNALARAKRKKKGLKIKTVQETATFTRSMNPSTMIAFE